LGESFLRNLSLNLTRYWYMKYLYNNNNNWLINTLSEGLQHLLFCINPSTFNFYLESIYIIINGLIQSIQGITVSILYCFTNSEVIAYSLVENM
jgi:hypothetical protein